MECYEALNENGKPFGWVVIDSVVNRQAHGGLRISPTVQPAELQDLARKMTLKFGFVGIPNGGAKAGVIGDPEAPLDERLSLLKKFCDAVMPLIQECTYHPHADMGTTRAEINKAFGRFDRGREPSREQSGFFTASSVGVCAKVAASHIGKSIQGMNTAIEGFGKVGSAVALLLSEMGAKIVAVSTSRGAIYRDTGLSVQQLIEFNEKFGSAFVEQFPDAEKIEIKQLLTLPVDLLCPCGAGWSIDTKLAQQIQASIISSGANSPVLPEAQSVLQNAGILNVPDFISNCGGVLGGTMFYAGLEPTEIRSLIDETLKPRLTKLFQQTWDRGISIQELAENEAFQRFSHFKEHAENPSFKEKVIGAGINLYKHHFIPRFLMRRISPSFFVKRMKD